MHSIEEAAYLLGTDNKLQVSLIKEGCRICEIPYSGGGVVFINKQSTLDAELNELKTYISSQVYSDSDYITVYVKQNRNHHKYSYYAIITIRSDNLLDLKKAFKIHSLKAFL